MVLIWVIAVIIAVVLFMVFRKARKGHKIGTHLFMFGNYYDDILNTTGSKEVALRQSLEVFKNCPGFDKLSDKDYDVFTKIIGPLPNPKNIVEKIILQLDSSRVVQVFRDENFLKKMASVYTKDVTAVRLRIAQNP
jgi:hypothetical protein